MNLIHRPCECTVCARRASPTHRRHDQNIGPKANKYGPVHYCGRAGEGLLRRSIPPCWLTWLTLKVRTSLGETGCKRLAEGKPCFQKISRIGRLKLSRCRRGPGRFDHPSRKAWDVAPYLLDLLGRARSKPFAPLPPSPCTQ